MNRPTRLGLASTAVVAAVSLIGCTSTPNDAVVPETTIDIEAVRPIQVYVIDTFVPKGADAETIKASLRIETIPTRLEQPGGVTDLVELDGKVAVVDLQPGDQLLAHRLVPAG